MGTVTIGGTSYEIYDTSTAANNYLKAHSNGAAWVAADTATKNKALVTAARSFDRQLWVGAMTDPVTPQPLAWPRTGIVDRNGQAVADSVIPQDVLEGNWEWALDIVQDASVAGASPGTNTKSTRSREKVDVIEVETETVQFKPTIGETARFPVAVMELIGAFLAGSDATLALASGTDEVSQFTTSDTDFGFNGIGIDGGSSG